MRIQSRFCHCTKIQGNCSSFGVVFKNNLSWDQIKIKYLLHTYCTSNQPLSPKKKNYKSWKFFCPAFIFFSFFFSQIMSDPRVRIEQSLWKAGLHHSPYAKKVLSTIQPPKPPRKDTKSTLKFWRGACLGSCVKFAFFFPFLFGQRIFISHGFTYFSSLLLSGFLFVLLLSIVVNTWNKTDVIFGLLL